MSAILELAANDNHVGHEIASLVGALRMALQSRCGRGSSFEERESTALSLSNEAIREVLEADLQWEADSIPDRVIVNDALYSHHQTGEVTYHSLVGPLRVQRSTYRQTGVRNGPTVVPLELEAGLVERATPALAYRVTLGFAKGPLRSCEEDLRASHRLPPSRTTMERMAKAIGQQAKEVVIRIEDHLRGSESVPADAHALTIGLDRTTIPMEEDRDPEESSTTRRKKRRKPYVRGPRPPVSVKYRMAYVGTVAFVESDGGTLVVRKYAVPAHEGPDGVVKRMMSDVLNALKQRPDIHLGLIQDGASELWGLMWDALDKNGLRHRCYQLYDRYHVSEHLAAVTHIIEPDVAKRRQLLDDWERRLDRYDNAIDRICDLIESKLTDFRFGSDNRKKLSNHLGYLTPTDRLRYARHLKQSLPIGSGVTEGACKSLIAARTKRSGQRWRPEGVSAVLALRSLQQSERLAPFWEHFKSIYGEAVPLAA